MSDQGREPVKDRRAYGRPRNPHRSTTVCTWVPEGVHDRLIQRADASGLSVSGYVKRMIVLMLDKPQGA